jgi:Helix-turn-helix.
MLHRMPATVHILNQALRLATQTRLRIGEELRQARLIAGLSQKRVAAALGCSAATISRVERGLVRNLSVEYLSRHAAVVGLVVRVNLFPTGSPLRDAGQLRLLNRFAKHVAAPWRWVLEMLVGRGDLRAFDAGVLKPGCRIGVDAWSRIRDVQAQVRATLRKQEDSGVDRVIILLADTQANRQALREAGESLKRAFPLGTREVLRALREGRDPGANGIVIL